MLLLDSEAISAVAHGPAIRRDRVRGLIAEMRRRELPVGDPCIVLEDPNNGPIDRIHDGDYAASADTVRSNSDPGPRLRT